MRVQAWRCLEADEGGERDTDQDIARDLAMMAALVSVMYANVQSQKRMSRPLRILGSECVMPVVPRWNERLGRTTGILRYTHWREKRMLRDGHHPRTTSLWMEIGWRE